MNTNEHVRNLEKNEKLEVVEKELENNSTTSYSSVLNSTNPTNPINLNTKIAVENNNANNSNDINLVEKNQAKTNTNLDNYAQQSRFTLRKRKSINYNTQKKCFEYESSSDSEFNLKSVKKSKKKITDKNSKTLKPTSKAKKPANFYDPTENRENQLNSLLNWKNKEAPLIKAKEYQYYEYESLLKNNKFDKPELDLEAILINPPWSDKFGFKEFEKINLPLKSMNEGLIFIWIEKEYLGDIINFFESKLIKYVENLTWLKLDASKKEQNTCSKTEDAFDLTDLYKVNKYEYLAKSKMTMLIFRKYQANGIRNLELRHQRTGDAVFDYDDPSIPFYRPFNYIYDLIETLLPKANYIEGKPLKMMEFWGQKKSYRKGWIHQVEL